MAAVQSMPIANKFGDNNYSQGFTQTSRAQNMKDQNAPVHNPAPVQRGGMPPLSLSYLPESTSINVNDRQNGYPYQLRTPTSPQYVPAVLRPTEKPQRSSPPRAYSGHAGPYEWTQHNEVVDTIQGGISGITRVETEDLNDDELGPVTGPPSTNHWKPDHTVTGCSANSCERDFTFFTRRHHCRRCGNIYCWEHVRNQAPLNQFALLHNAGHRSKVCDRCFGHYKSWQNRRLSRTDSESSTPPAASPALAIATPHIRASSTTASTNLNVGSVPGSVGGFNWSTF